MDGHKLIAISNKIIIFCWVTHSLDGETYNDK